MPNCTSTRALLAEADRVIAQRGHEIRQLQAKVKMLTEALEDAEASIIRAEECRIAAEERADWWMKLFQQRPEDAEFWQEA